MYYSYCSSKSRYAHSLNKPLQKNLVLDASTSPFTKPIVEYMNTLIVFFLRGKNSQDTPFVSLKNNVIHNTSLEIV
jgi:hypothetical protein